MPASNVTIAASFKIVKYNVSFAATTHGTVSVNPSQYAKGATVALSVVPETGYVLDKLVVKDANGAVVDSTDNKFVMPASNVSVTATFKEGIYRINIGTFANGVVSVEAANVQMGHTVTLKIQANTGYELDTLVVKDASGNILTVNDGKFMMPKSNVTVTATFKVTKYLVEIVTPTNGSMSVNPDKYAKGETVSLVITPAAGYELDKLTVKDAENKDVAVSGNKFVMPASKATVSATFKKSTYKITVNEATKGKVTADVATAKIGDTVALTITPETGYELWQLTVKDAAGKDVAVAADGKFTMPASNVTITATFRVIPVEYTLTVDSAIANGTVTAKIGTDAVTKAKNGDTITLAIEPATGYKLKELTVKDAINAAVSVEGTGNTRTFTMPANNVTITATFEQIV